MDSTIKSSLIASQILKDRKMNDSEDIVLRITQDELEAMLDTCNRVLQQESYVATLGSEDLDAVDSDAYFAYHKAECSANILKNRVCVKENKLFLNLLHSAFVNELDTEFMEYPLKDGFLVFFVDGFTDEMLEVRCLKPNGYAVIRGTDDVVRVPTEKDSILVTTEVSWW